MPKRSASTSVEHHIYERIAKVAEVDKRSIAQIIETCIEHALEEIEAEVEEKLKARNKKPNPGNSHFPDSSGQQDYGLAEAKHKKRG